MSNQFMVGSQVVADALDISVPTVNRLARNGKLPFPSQNFGRTVRFLRKDVEAYLGEPLTPTQENA